MASSSIMSSTLPREIKSLLQPSPLSTSLILTTTPVPQPVHMSDHLVKVHATCPCAGELLWARDYPGLLPADKLPVPSQDLCGQVVTAPPHSRFHPGDEVYARIPADRPGAAREYTLARETELSHKPQSLNFIEAAATPLSALTAWQALFVHGTLDMAAVVVQGSDSDSDGDGDGGEARARRRNGRLRVLVTAATGGVGSWAVQLAAAAGAGAVVAVCGRGKAPLAAELGAAEVVDYTAEGGGGLGAWVARDRAGRECDLVVDCVGGATLAQCWGAVREGGTLLSVVGDPNSVRPREEGGSGGADAAKRVSKAAWFLVEPLGRTLDDISALIDAGRVRPLVDSVWEFAEYEKAFAKIEAGHAKGKVVIKIDGLV